MVGSRYAGRRDSDKKGQTTTGQEIHPRLADAERRIGIHFFPAEGTPKGLFAKNGESDVQEEDNQAKPQDTGADKKLRAGLDDPLKLPLREALVSRVVDDDAEADADLTEEAEK